MMLNLKKNKVILLILLIIFIAPSFIFVSCNNKTSTTNINLFNTESQSVENIDLETYLQGVVAGEMSNEAPVEALKAQAVLARTFTLKFINNNNSKYKGADISTDITEAQAYNPDYINDNIKTAVKETEGLAIYNGDELINAWFHANSGGYTSSAKDGLNIIDNEPSYIKSRKTGETSQNTKNYSWSYTFEKDGILNTLRDMGISVSSISTFEKGEISNSGRCKTFIIGGKEVSANTFRLNIGSTKLKSTLINSIKVNQTTVTFNGQGYGHGVGLSQEYAIALAKEGKNYKEILSYFFENISIK